MTKLSWLNARFVEKVLQKADNDESIEISNITVNPATSKGDNYASDLHRVKIQLSRICDNVRKTETRSVVVKVELQDGIWKEMVLNCGMFELEMLAMMETLPMMNRMIAEIDTISFSARCLQVQYEHPMYLIIEDLSSLGFRMAENRANLDLDHCLIAMRNIAAFHAVSVALAEKYPDAMNKYKRNQRYENPPDPFVALFITANAKALSKEVAHWPELDPRIAEKLLKLSGSIWQKECETSVFLEDDFNVLNHGDYTSINMLFRYNEKQEPIEQIFVDFQLSRYGSPAIDILFFFATSPSTEVRLDKREIVLREYHNSLINNMTKLKCRTKSPSFNELQEILRKRAFFEVGPSLTILANALADKKQVKSIDERIASAKKSDNSVYQGKLYRNLMTRLLPIFDNMGLLES